MTTTESIPVYYSIESPDIDYFVNGTILPNTKNVVTLTGNFTGEPHYISTKVSSNAFKGVFLKTSGNKVTVTVQSGGRHTTDTYLALPIRNSYIQEYVYYPFSMVPFVADSSVVIVGTEDVTTLTITASVNSKISLDGTIDWINLYSGEKYSYVINKLQIVYLSTNFMDLTGSKIVADKPLSIISGHECAFVPSYTSSVCDHLIEQVLPTSQWGTTYYTAPLAYRKSYTLKIIAAHNITILQIICNGIQKIYQINDGEFLKQTFYNQEYCAIHSNKKISVVQISHGADEDNLGNPMVILVPAVKDYSNKLMSFIDLFSMHTTYKHYVINVFVLAQYYQPNLIYLTTEGINQTLESYNWVPIVVNNITEAYATEVHMDVVNEIFQIIHFNNSALMSGITYAFNIKPIRQRSVSLVGFDLFNINSGKLI